MSGIRATMTLLEVIDGMLALFGTRDAWTQLASARDIGEHPVAVDDVYAKSWCMTGGAYRCLLLSHAKLGTDINAEEFRDRLGQLLANTPTGARIYSDYVTVIFDGRDEVETDGITKTVRINDYHRTTYEDVCAVLREAREIAAARNL